MSWFAESRTPKIAIGSRVRVGLDDAYAIIVALSESGRTVTVSWDLTDPRDRLSWEVVPVEQLSK